MKNRISLLFTLILIAILVNAVQAQETDYELLWSYETGSTIGEVSISADGNYVAVGTEDNKGNKVYFFDKQGRLLWSYKTDGKVYAVSVSEEGNYVAAGSEDNKVYLFDRNGKLLWSYKTDGWVGGVSVSEEGNYVAAGSFDNKVYLFDKEGKLLWYRNPYGLLCSASISADGNYAAVGDCGINWLGWEFLSYNEMYFFNKVGELLWSFKAQTVGFSVSASGNGSLVTAGSRKPDNKLYLFDRDGKLLWNYEIGNDIYSVSISSDGNYIAARSNKVYLLNKEGKLIWNYDVGDVNSGVEYPSYGISVSSDGSYISIGGGGKVHLFVKTKIIATNALNEAKSAISSIKSKGFAVTNAESLLLLAENAFKSEDYKKAKSLAESAKVEALKIDKVASGASSSISKAKSAILQEKSKRFTISKAELLLFQAENTFNSGDYERAREIADESYYIAIDIDQDGMPNSEDFAPTIRNTYIYSGAAIFFVGSIIALRIHQRLANEKRKQREMERESKERMKQDILNKIKEVTKNE